MRTSAKLGIAAACALSLGMLATSHDASACGGHLDYVPTVDERPFLVANAEEQVEAGRTDYAAFGLVRSFPNLRQRQMGLSHLGDRAIKAMALAVVRGDGSLPVTAFAADSDEARSDNLQWALHVLHANVRRHPDDMVLASEFAEGLAKLPERRIEAYRLLRSLEARDLLADAHGYAALADLRRRSHEGKPAFVGQPLRALEHASALLATARCFTMAKDREVCGELGEQKLARR